jgi:hypothetical protein
LAKKLLPSVFLALGKETSLPRAIYRTLGKASLASAEALPSVFYLALGKAFFAEYLKKNARQSLRCSAKKQISVVAGAISGYSLT